MTRLPLRLCVAALALAPAFAPAASSTVYGTLAQWSAAAGGTVTTQNFSSYTSGPLLPGVTVTTNIPPIGVFDTVANGKVLFATGNRFDDGTLSAAPYYEFQYASPYRAAALDIAAFESFALQPGGTSLNASLNVYFDDGTSRNVMIAPNDGSPIFLGIIADKAISRIRFTEVLEASVTPPFEFIGYEETVIDNVRVAEVIGGPIDGQVPEPSTYLMLLSGLGLLGFIARRRAG